MRLSRILLALIFSATLFVSCSVDELDTNDNNLNQTEDILATGDDDDTANDEKGNG